MKVEALQSRRAANVCNPSLNRRDTTEARAQAGSTSARVPRIISIGGGKGGVGKTLVATMLGICLGEAEKKVIIVDADFSGANLHACLGAYDAQTTLQRYMERQSADLNDVAIETAFKNLRIITGMPGPYASAQIRYWEKQKLLRNLKKLLADYVILDLGPGSFYTNVDFFLSSDDKVIVSTADPLAMYDAYGFLRVALFRRLQKTFHSWPEILRRLQECGDLAKGNKARSLRIVLENSPDIPPSCRELAEKQVASFRPKIVINLVRETDNRKEMDALRLVSKNLLGIDIDFWGQIRFDSAVVAAIKSMQPEMLLAPKGMALNDVHQLAQRLLTSRAPANAARDDSRVAKETVRSTTRTQADFIRVCNYRCIAWNCCDERSGGYRCFHLTPPAPKLRYA